MLGKCKGAEEKSGVEGITGEGVAEEGQARDVASGEAGWCVRVGDGDLPDSEVGDKEELERAEKYGSADAENVAVIGKPGANQHAEEEAGIHNGNEAVKADKEVTGEECHEWKKKCYAAIAKHRSRKKGHGADRREIPRMRKAAHCGGENDHYRGENGAKHKNVSGRFFLEHDLNQISF
jgi:hypothetical protein